MQFYRQAFPWGHRGKRGSGFCRLQEQSFRDVPEALDIYRVHHNQAACYVLRLNIAAQLHCCGDTGIFAAVDACGNKQGGTVLVTVDNSQRDFYIGVRDRQVRTQFSATFNSQSTYLLVCQTCAHSFDIFLILFIIFFY